MGDLGKPANLGNAAGGKEGPLDIAPGMYGEPRGGMCVHSGFFGKGIGATLEPRRTF